MRPKSKTLAKEQVLLDDRALLFDPAAPAIDWEETFGRTGPLHVEIGMGAGRHLAYQAKAQPETLHVGIEEKYYRVHKGIRWLDALQRDNIRFVVGDFFKMTDLFAPGSVDAVTMLFPDPWPRAKGERFRLTNPVLVERYYRWLKPGGRMTFRTDHEWLYHYSRERFRRAGFELVEAVPLERIQSDFERRYLEEGRAVYGLVATRPVTERVVPAAQEAVRA